jgi:hypothetical protein
MKTKLLAALFAALMVTSGCISTVTGGKVAGVPFLTDAIQSEYKLPPEVIFVATKEVIKADGVLTSEGINYSPTNAVKTVQGKVDQCSVWVRIAPLDPQVTSVAVQVRTGGGGSNMSLAQQIDKEIAVKLASRSRR